METAELSEALHVLELGLTHSKWRLRPSTKRRLEIADLLPQETPTFKHLRVLLIDDMIFLVHSKRLAEYVQWTLNPDAGQLFIDLKQDPPKTLQMITQTENSLVGAQLVSIWNLFAVHFPVIEEPSKDLESSVNGEPGASRNPGIIDLSSCMQGTKISIPTLNGWLLGYPIIYLFSTEHIEDAIYNLSTKYIRIFRVLVCRKMNPNPGKSSQQEEELMSFLVPYELSMGRSKEPWAEAFTARAKANWESCKHVWKSLRMEVTECYPQAIVL